MFSATTASIVSGALWTNIYGQPATLSAFAFNPGFLGRASIATGQAGPRGRKKAESTAPRVDWVWCPRIPGPEFPRISGDRPEVKGP
jgi:hypothetical protein